MEEISAGGVVFRTYKGSVQIQLIQDRYGKATLPKGKLEAGETIEQAALREIEEETGITGRIIDKLETIAYTYQHPLHGTIDKEVHYYLVEAVGGVQQPQVEEIRGVEWFDVQEAWRRQSQDGYGNNNEVVRKAVQKLGYEVNE